MERHHADNLGQSVTRNVEALQIGTVAATLGLGAGLGFGLGRACVHWQCRRAQQIITGDNAAVLLVFDIIDRNFLNISTSHTNGCVGINKRADRSFLHLLMRLPLLSVTVNVQLR